MKNPTDQNAMGPPFVSITNVRPNGSRDVTIRFPLGAGQVFRLHGWRFVEGGPTVPGYLGIASLPRWRRRKWWEVLLRRPRRPEPASVDLSRNGFYGSAAIDVGLELFAVTGQTATKGGPSWAR